MGALLRRSSGKASGSQWKATGIPVGEPVDRQWIHPLDRASGSHPRRVQRARIRPLCRRGHVWSCRETKSGRSARAPCQKVDRNLAPSGLRQPWKRENAHVGRHRSPSAAQNVDRWAAMSGSDPYPNKGCRAGSSIKADDYDRYRKWR